MAACHLWLLTGLAILLTPPGVYPRPKSESKVEGDKIDISKVQHKYTVDDASDISKVRKMTVDNDDDIDISKVRSTGPKFSLDSIEVDRTSRYLLGSRVIDRVVVDFLDTLPEDDLRAMEELAPSNSSEDEEGMEDDSGYLPQGDMPASAEYNGTQTLNMTDAEGNYTDQLQKANRESPDMNQVERTKEMRLNSIKTQILSYLGLLGGQPNISNNNTSTQQAEIIREMYDKMKRLPQWPPSDVYTEKVQSFYPSCELPRNTDEELWSNGESMHLLFDLSFPTSLQGNVVNIIAAKLRLHKVSQANMTVAVSETCPPPPTPLFDDQAPPAVAFKPQTFHLSHNPASPITVDDKKIRVSIYWYTRSLKKHRVKRKLLDSQMVSVYGDAWTEWNVRSAVKAWKESNKNFGLAIEVEDEDGNLLPAHNYFSPMNCSKEASTSRPIPGFLVDAARLFSLENQSEASGGSSSSAYHFNTHMFPMIDLCTVELPESEIAEAVLYHNAKFALERQLLTVVRNNSISPADNDNDGRHRIRHQNHHRIVVMNSTAVEAMADAAASSIAQGGPASASLISSPQPARQRHHTEVVRRDNGDSVEEMTLTTDDLDGDQLRKHIIVQKVIKRNRQAASSAD
ncbi:hypothetical protein LSTR_LSTR013648 [Laodelphax striatellus]|uniref:TGF-beta propeptide domain-containing protein n=1 Tax=Laodelphax striatellus TaxID=195883 RepID=A0A482XHY8_LAOST|nr:hypothetical protein LSTR_LSTR013648 [Laodelphax striatellus]